MGHVTEAYERQLAAGVITPDPVQAEAVARLDDLADRLATRRKGNWLRAAEDVTGLYMWGGVGRGKSMLMDLFFEASSVKLKKRVHFHEFINRIHDEIAVWRGLDKAARRRSEWRVKGAGDDPIAPVAKKIAAEAELLCFDEFQVTQIADAMILSRLFEALFARGVTVVATSNRHPDDLYKHGINRQLFTPFIALLKQKCAVFELASARDYRLERLQAAPVWQSPLGPGADAAMDAAWGRLTLGAAAHATVLMVKTRKLHVPQEAAGVARFTFKDLCAQPLGSADYITIASTFHTIILDHIPVLSPENRNEAARFTALIDALYEAKVKLVASAAAEPDELYQSGTGSFEFERTASRLYEMRSADYLSAEREAATIV